MKTENSRPNVVLLCTDQWRADCLGVEGHPDIETPYLDQFAADGCRFRRAYAAVPSCIAARASLLTGQTPRTHGRVGYRDGVPWTYPITIASSFRDQGYQTHCAGKMHVHPARNRMGFDDVDLHDGYLHYGRKRTGADLETVDDYLPWLKLRAGHDADYFDAGVHCNAYTPHPWDKDERLHPTAWVSTMGADFMRRRDTTRPFFLMLSYHRPHPPLDPPAWAYDQYLQKTDLARPDLGNWEEDLFRTAYQNATCTQPPKTWPWERIRRARAAYYAQITFIDHQIQRFVETLDEYGQLGNTVFCFVSDHGEMLGDHHQYAKSVSYEGSARIPMLFFSPRSDRIPKGRVDETHVAELRDVMQTLLDAAGLEIPASVEGRSLLPADRGDPVRWRSYLHGEHPVGYADIGSMHYIVTAEWKYIWHSGSGREQLFDLKKDPRELCDLTRTDPSNPHLATLRRHLMTELAGREEGFVRNGKLVAGCGVIPVLSVLSKPRRSR
ncbi:MAG: arylsulfatase [Kiritimatiellia bacterium]|nr:arylsulfatase [Kiritimatiellia bacterium]